MKKVLCIIFCCALLFAFPLSCLAEGETANEAMSEYKETTKFNPIKTYVDYNVIPLSGQIKVVFPNKDPEVYVEIQLSTDNKDFRFIDCIKDDCYVISNLNHREKYYIRLITSCFEYGEYEHLSETQSIRTK